MALNSAQVKAKARVAVKRREEIIEQEEIEGGEINLIPYLDIVTNLMLFLLASISAGLILGQLNTTLPDQGPASASMSQDDPNENPDDKPLKLVVSVLKEKITLWSITELEGKLKEPKLELPLVGKLGDICTASYECSSNTCKGAADGKSASTCVANPDGLPDAPVFDYRKLNDALFEIADRRYKGKKRKLKTYQAILMADGTIPYGTIISVMDAMRCKMPAPGTLGDCYFPSADEAIKKLVDPIDVTSRLYDADRVPYDATKMALFHDILFSSGFE
jgi:biopolymer transport protein ExbD